MKQKLLNHENSIQMTKLLLINEKHQQKTILKEKKKEKTFPKDLLLQENFSNIYMKELDVIVVT